MDNTYDPKKVSVTVADRIMTGFSEDSIIKIASSGDAVTPTVGVQGDVSYTESADKSGTLTLSFAQTSASIAYLRKLYNNKTSFAVVVNDANDGMGFLLSASGCRITKMPDIERGKSIATQEITIHIPNITLD